MRVVFTAAFVGFVSLFGVAGTGFAARAPLVADLSEHLVAITTGFAGTDVLLFGATDDEGDVVVVVRGPSHSIPLHRKSEVLGIWVNTASMQFERVPSFYAVAASRPLEALASEAELNRHEIGLEHLKLRLPRAKASENVAMEWREALIRTHVRANLFQPAVGRVAFLGNRLFRAQFHLPANVPTGSYQVQVFLIRNQRVQSAQITPLIVSKIGAQAEIFDFAHQRSALYGAVAISLALFAGWLGNAMFRKS